jgi:NAD(P)H dehydrogenase (quinone)
MNLAFGTNLVFKSMSVEEYREDRMAELGEFIGTIIAGIYQGIRKGKANNPSDYEKAAGRPHVSWQTFFTQLSNNT